MTRSLSFIITLLLFLTQLQADVIARLIKVEGNVYFKRMGMETFSEKAKIQKPKILSIHQKIFLFYFDINSFQ